MRAVCLALALMIPAPAAMAAEPTFIDLLAARGPQDLHVSEGLGPVLPDAKARVSVENGVIVVEIRRGKDGPAEIFRYGGKGFEYGDVWRDPGPDLEIGRYCNGGGGAERYEIQCFTRSSLRSRALRPPSTVWTLRLSEDGLRVVRAGLGERVTLTPLNPTPKGARWLAPGVAANLGDALAQLAAHRDGYMYGGASGGGEWYGSDLLVRDVSGLDFRLERTVMPDRGGRSDMVPATWSFDYQGPDRKDPARLTWLMARERKGVKAADFWCVGRTSGTVVSVDCHKGGKPSDVNGKPDVRFALQPFPEWQIRVETGSDNAFSSVGSSRLEPLPFP